MHTKINTYVSILFIGLVLFTGCERNLDLPTSDTGLKNKDLSISEIKAWYIKQKNNPTGRSAVKYNKEVLWEFYQNGSFSNGRPYIVTTLAYANGDFLRADEANSPLDEFEDKFNGSEGLLRKALFFKDVTGEYQKYILYIIPDSDYAKTLKKSPKRKSLFWIG